MWSRKIKPLGCGFLIQDIKSSLKNKLSNLPEQEAQGIQQKIEQVINNEAGLAKLQLDENGNRLVEIELDIDGVTEKVPIL